MLTLREALPGAAAVLVLGSLLAARGQAGPDRDLLAARTHEARLQALIARLSSSVVTIGVELPAEEGGLPVKVGGSGVVIDAKGLILTNDHVTEGRDEVAVGLPGGQQVDGQVLGRDPDGDLALVQVAAPGLPAVAMGDSEALAAGDPVLALGNPFGLAGEEQLPAASLGIVSATGRYLGGSKVYGDAIQIDAPVNPGNSGGPLFDLEGRLVGINGRISVRGASRHNVGVGYAVPTHEIALVLPELLAGRDVKRGWLGVRFFSRGDGRPGVVVRDVVPGSPAAVAGVESGDRIVAAQGKRLDHPVRLQNYLTALPAGTRVTLAIERGEERLELTAVLGRRPGS